MNKLILGIIVGMLLIGLVGAGILGFSKAEFTTSNYVEPTREAGVVTFIVNGKDAGTCYLNEPNMNIDDDFEECVNKKYPNADISFAKDWTNRDYVTSTDGLVRSFDEQKIDAYENPIEEEPKGEEEI